MHFFATDFWCYIPSTAIASVATNAPKPTQFLATCDITLEVYYHVDCRSFLEDNDHSFAECLLRKISSTCVDTKPRGIVATCIITGDRGVHA